MKPPGRPPMYGERLVHRSIALPREVWSALAREAKARGVTIAALVRERLSS